MSELTGSSLMPTRAAGWTSDNPYTFENMATAGGKTWPGLIHVKSGDRLIFVNQYAYGNTSYSDFVGIDFTISEVPEPGAMVSLGSGLIGLLGFALRRRR
jgi:hypothetical protein